MKSARGVIIADQGGVTRNEELVMAGTARLLLVLALLGGTLSASRGYAQTAEDPAAAGSESAPSLTTPEPEFLKTFPRPPDQPASLMAPVPPLGPPPPNLERPYFELDPLLNPPALGLVGWFADLDIGLLKPHLLNHETLPVTLPDGTTVRVAVNASRLNWTIAPRFEVGYRFASGFGGIAVSYRNLASQGSEAVIGADGPARLSSRLNANVASLDWVSNEYTPWKVCEMRLHFGLRYINVYYDSQADTPFAAAAAGTTIFNQRTTDHTWVFGPHFAVDLRRRLNFWGLAVLGFVEMSEGWGRVSQNYFASSTTSVTGLPQAGHASIGTSDAVPVLSTRLGLVWQPPAYPTIHLFAGGQLDYWWNVGRMGNFTEFGYFFDSGLLLRGEWNY